MKRFFSLSLLLFLILGEISAQEAKKVVAVSPVSSSKTREAMAYANALTEIIVTAVVKSNRFTVVDRSSFSALMTEENLQKGESFIDGLVVEQGKKLGAEVIVTGNLNTIGAEPRYTIKEINGREKRVLAGYTANISYTLKLIDVVTGQITGSQSFGNKSGSLLFFDTNYPSEEQAISEALKRAEPNIHNFLDAQFPLKLRIFEVTEQKKGYAREIVVTGGKGQGLKLGQYLKVVYVSQVEVDGRTLQRQKGLGWVQITSVDDENFSTCKVKRTGGDKVLSYYEKDPDKVYVLTGQSDN